MKKRSTGKHENAAKRRKIQHLEKDTDALQKTEFLNFKNLREGQVVLGCVREKKSNCLVMSLPGCLEGIVLPHHISKAFTERLTRAEQEQDISLESMAEVGEVFPCKVMSKYAQQGNRTKNRMTLSIDPRDIQSELREPMLYNKMVLYAAVESIEDHGFVMDIGMKGVQSFLPLQQSGNDPLTIGRVYPTYIQKMSTSKLRPVIQLCLLGQEDAFPQVEEEEMKLSSILPGATLKAIVTDVSSRFLRLDCQQFPACAGLMSAGESKKKIDVGSEIVGTVLYVHPITRLIYLMLRPKPTPGTIDSYFPLKQFEFVKNPKYRSTLGKKLFFMLKARQSGFMMKKDLVGNEAVFEESVAEDPKIPRARVTYLHYMDNLVQLSSKKSVLNIEIKKLEDIAVGDTLQGKVVRHREHGMLVSICPGLKGFVQNIQMADVFVTMPGMFHPVGSKVKCRVLNLHPQHGLGLTCKESLVDLPQDSLLQAYEDAIVGHSYKGVIFKKEPDYMLVTFFNDVRGIVHKTNIPKSSIHYLGQAISCEVVKSDPSHQRLLLTLSDVKPKSKKNTKKEKSSENGKNAGDFAPQKKHQAIITRVKATQLDVVVNGTMKGRVHLTEISSDVKEDQLLIPAFRVGQGVSVHVLGQFTRKAQNYLAVTNPQLNHVAECALVYPPPAPLDMVFKKGMNVCGYVRMVNLTNARIWLSPMHSGRLDFIHYSDNPKVLRSLKKQLKVGRSIHATILDVIGRPKGSDIGCRVSLTKLNSNPVQKGRNCVGLVTAIAAEGLLLELPCGYRGTVSLTDLQDKYMQARDVMARYKKLKFITCRVLEVNEENKTCVLSLRKTRMYDTEERSPNIQPELTTSNLPLNSSIKGFVTSINSRRISVYLGRELDGQMALHECSVADCASCRKTEEVLKKYRPLDVVEVVVNDREKREDGFYSIQLVDFIEKLPNQSRLTVDEDVDWSEM